MKSTMVIPPPRIRVSLGIALLAIFTVAAHAQRVSVSPNFGSFYGTTSGTQTVNVFVGAPGEFQISQNQAVNVPGGTIEMPTGWTNISGHGTFTIPIQFYPNSSGGTFSGSFTATYTNSENYSQPLYVTVNYSGENMVPTANASPKYQVLSILYIAPGNASTSGFSTSQSEGATTSISQNFSNSETLAFNYGFLGVDNGVTFGSSQSQGDSSSYTTSYQTTSGSQLASTQQKMDHTQDQIYLLVDPTVTVTQTGSASGTYALGPSVDATGNFPNGTVPADILNSNVAGFRNPTQIPLNWLESQIRYSGTTLPGLKSICANPLPDSECTSQNACGCTAADFAQLIPQDELANVTSDTTSPSSIDSNRYVLVTSLFLQGPEQQGAAPVKNPYTVTDSNMSLETLSNGTSYSVGYDHKFGYGGTGPFGLQITATDTFTYSQTETAGTSTTTGHTAQVTLGTSDVGCGEYVDVYEDTIYHTFAYALPQAAPSNCQ